MAVKGVALPGDELDPTRPRLINLNQDPLFSECLVYYVREDAVTFIGSDVSADIQVRSAWWQWITHFRASERVDLFCSCQARTCTRATRCSPSGKAWCTCAHFRVRSAI
jgi:hypothetical protein